MAADTTETDAEIAALNKEAELEAARTKAATAAAERLEAERALAKAQSPSGQHQDDLADKKAVADATAALATAETSAKIAEEIGNVGSTSYSGKVTLNEKSGTVEALLLASRAVTKTAGVIAETVKVKINDKTVNVIAKRDFTNFQKLSSFRVKKALVQQAMTDAVTRSDAVIASIEDPTKPLPAGAAPAVAGAALKAMEGLLSFFKTDYEFGGVQVTIEESAAVTAVAGALALLDGVKTRTPVIYEPDASTSGSQAVAGELSALATTYGECVAKRDELKKLVAKTSDLQKGEIEGAIAQTTGAITTYQDFLASLNANDAAGTATLVSLAREIVLDKKLTDGEIMLLVGLENTGGGYFIKKNILSGLFGAPLYHMGGATLSYVLLGRDGVMSAGLVPHHGGFIKSRKLEATLKPLKQ